MTARKYLPWVEEEAGSYSAGDGEGVYYAYRTDTSNWGVSRTTLTGRIVIVRNAKTLAMAKRGAEAHAAKQAIA
jgi:hypothetical protein